MLKLSLLIQLTERVTAPVRRIRSAISGMAISGKRDVASLDSSVERLGRDVGRAKRPFDALRSTISRAVGNGQRDFTRLAQAVNRVIAPIRRLDAATKRMVVMGERDVKRLDRMMERLGRTANRVGRSIGTSLRWGALAVAGASTGMIASIIKTTSQFEQFQVVLENTEGSAAGAKRAMAWVTDFAKRTPYELSDVMEAFVQLKAYGIDPIGGALESLGNAASGMNKPLMSAIEMLADAQTGEFERLKEFGVRAKAVGDSVKLTYMKAGKEVTVTSKKSAGELQKVVLGIFDARFAGMMDRQSKTLGGLWSNLKDQLSNFELDIGKAGIFDYVKTQIQQLLTYVNKLAANGTLQRWAKQISGRFVELAEKLKTVDWKAVWADLKGIGSALLAIGGFFAMVERVFGLFNVAIAFVIGRIAFAMYGLATALGVVSIAGLPIAAVVAIVAVLAFAAFKLWQNWSTITAKFAKMWEGVKGVFRSAAAAIWAGMPSWLKGAFTGAKFVLNLVANAAGLVSGSSQTGARPGQPARPGVRQGDPGSALFRNGRRPTLGPPLRQPGARSLIYRSGFDARAQIDLNIKTARGVEAKTSRLRSSDRRVALNVNRGLTNVA